MKNSHSTKSLQRSSVAASHQRCCYVKQRVPKNLANFTEKHLCWSLFLTKLPAWRSTTLSKRGSSTVTFLRNLLNFKNTYFEEHLWATAPDTSRGVIELRLKDFVLKWMFMNFLNFLLWAVYYGNTSWAI